MLNKLIGFAARIAFGKQLLGLVHGLNEKLTGHRTQVIIVLAAGVALLGHFGLLTQDQSQAALTALLGALPLTLAEKVKNALAQADKILPKPEEPKPS